MPLFWLPIPTTVVEALQQPAAVQQPSTVIQRIDEYLVVSAQSSTYDPVARTFIFTKGVTAAYDVTTIKADRLEIHMAEGEQWARATGNVVVEDPDANISARDLEFTWKPNKRSGTAKGVSVRLGHVHIEAAEATITPERWEFRTVSATNCPEYFWIKSPRLVIVPGRRGTLEDPSLYVLGRKIATLPDRSFNLDPRTQGIGLPSISYRRDGGFGVSWEAGVLVNQNTNIYASAAIFKGSYPSLSFVATRSLLPPSEDTAIITPGNEIGERFRFGYLENVTVDRPSEELRYIRTERKSLSVGTMWNQGVSRNYETSVSKSLEGVFESGGVFGAKKVTRKDEDGKPAIVKEGGLGYVAQLRLQSIRERGSPFVSRALVAGAVELPSIPLAPKVSTLSRVDMNHFLGKNQYGWVRGIFGVVYEPNKQVRLAGGFMTSAQHGTPDFQFDQLVAERGIQLRADFDLGPTQISYLTKYDKTLGWYDREYSISQVAGCFEPFLVYRKFPADYRLGIRLRLDNFTDILSRRQFKREPAKKTTISPMPDGHP